MRGLFEVLVRAGMFVVVLAAIVGLVLIVAVALMMLVAAVPVPDHARADAGAWVLPWTGIRLPGLACGGVYDGLSQG